MSNDASANVESLANHHETSARAASTGAAAGAPSDAGECGQPTQPDIAQSAAAAASFHDAYTSAYRNFYQKLEAAWHSVDVRQSLAEAEFELQCKLASFPGPERELERCEATADYLRLVQHLNSPLRRKAKIAFAFERYIDEVQAIWRRPDIHVIDPREISTFGQSIAWAAYYASMAPSS